jgi:hypothetical protein
LAAGGWSREAGQRAKVSPGSGQVHQRFARHGRTDAMQQLEDSERGDDVPRILDPAQNAQHVLDVRRFEELQATVF